MTGYTSTAMIYSGPAAATIAPEFAPDLSSTSAIERWDDNGDGRITCAELGRTGSRRCSVGSGRVSGTGWPRRWAITESSSQWPSGRQLSLLQQQGNYELRSALPLSRSRQRRRVVVLPLDQGQGRPRAESDSGFVEQISAATELRFVSDGYGDLRKTFSAVDALDWIYEALHSPSYHEGYEAQFKLDFPRVPLPGSTDLFRKLAEAGHELLVLYVIEFLKFDEFITTYTGPRSPEVDRVDWSDGTVWLDADKAIAREGHRVKRHGTIGFQDLPEEVWDFHIGGYQVCHKWLGDRKGCRLSDEDIAHYRKIVVALNETVRTMAQIDEVIEFHGGGPDAFQIEPEAAPEGTAKVVSFRPRTVEPAPEDRYVTCVPLVPLKAAADDGESEAVKFKATLRVNLHTGEPDKRMELAALKTLAGFLNTNGGP